ncbi:MAG: 1-(5-phosphoribosyl)-5-[(5-phosphoribosylamino)methylideneamino]imidazole-4-carboxamide isomerase [Paracoccaceae bacterium]|nr:1-(5-phosphoribosyl)-5-[(5-phosphoribosylamino)methylideneamino]imidazole-4-carboxamide isomerase [Paracoccaceae bacterium]
MIFYPAIDIKDGKCVRLLRGNMQQETIFNNSPEEQAKIFERLGCEWLHLIDLNGAFEGLPVNHQAVIKILNKVNIPIQIGGGIRSIKTIEYWIHQGLSRIILGTAAVNNPELIKLATKEFPNKIAVSIDAKNGYVATNGWAQTTSVTSLELAKQLEGIGVSYIIYTDIDRDGAMNGPNIEQTETLAKSISIPVIASGGISSLDDLKTLKQSSAKLNGVISGRAIYNEIFTINEAINILRF